METSQLEIRVARAADTGRLLRFFRQTAYVAEQVNAHAVVLSAPEDADDRVARREVGIYLRMLERLHPGLGASIMD